MERSAVGRAGLVGFFAGVLMLGGCTMLDLRRDLQAYPASIVLHGRVEAPTGYVGPVVIVARFRKGSPGAPEQRVRLERPGPFELILGQQPDRVMAYGDRDGGDPSGLADLCATAVLTSASDDDPPLLRLEIGSDSAPCASRNLEIAASASRPRSAPKSPTGRRVDMDDRAMSVAFARESYWEPGRYLREKGSNIYLVEAYDPTRIPILFVYGAAGSAQDWRYFLQRIDRRRFQPWVYVYASGAPLSLSADLLRWRLRELRARLHFERLCITAHSMGGLVVRKLLLEPLDQSALDVLFVSLSTPWGGDEGAAIGARFAPVVVPSWDDLDPAGRFLAGLYAHRFTEGVSHHLYFGYRRGIGISNSSSDGVIAMSSQLSAAAQNEARSIVGFDVDHDGILQSPAVLDRYDALLDAWAAGRAIGEVPAEAALRPRAEKPVTPRSLNSP